METKKFQFLDSVHIDNPEYVLDSERLDYYQTSKTHICMDLQPSLERPTKYIVNEAFMTLKLKEVMV